MGASAVSMAATEWPAGLLAVPATADSASFVLRRWHQSDVEQLVAAWGDPEVAKWTNPPAPSMEVAKRWIAGWQRRSDTGVALDVVIDVDGKVAGEVGLASFVAQRRAATVGYWTAPWARGQGLASQATHAVARWFLAPGGCAGSALLATCHVENQPAHRVATRAGFVKLGASPSDPQTVVFACRAEIP